MNVFTIKGFGAAALVICGSTAVTGAAGAQTVSDEVRCVALGNALAKGSKDPRVQQVGTSIGAYFLGRLDARQPAQVKAAIAAQKNLVASEATAEIKSCAARAKRAETQLHALAN